MIRKTIISMLFATLLLALSLPVDASAASAWSFHSAQERIKNGGTIIMTYYQYKNFDLLKNDKLVTESKDSHDDYTVTWKSSNEEAVWINKHTGQARANKFNQLQEDFATVKISVEIKNGKTGKQITQSFNVEVDNRAYTKNEEPVTEATPVPEVEVTPTPTPDVTETPTVTKRNGIKKLTLGSTWKTDVSVLLDTFDFFNGNETLKAEDILGIDSVDCVEVGTPVKDTYIRTISLKVRVKALNPNWENPEHYIVEKVEINHYFEVVQ